MKNKWIGIFVVIVVVVIVVVVILDVVNNKVENRGGNPYEYSVDEYKEVDPELILFKETRNIRLGETSMPKAMSYGNEMLYLASEGMLQGLSPDGLELFRTDLEHIPSCITAGTERLYLGFGNFIGVYDLKGNKLSEWQAETDSTIFTSVGIGKDIVFAADAGKRRIVEYSLDGKVLKTFEGKHSEDDLHGFIVPSPYFDLVVNNDGELWVVNPGAHALENYTIEGELRGYWYKTSIKIDGFSGCCNPAQITVFTDGSFVTSEKGMVRIKWYKPSGELIGVVAPPASFVDDGHAPEVCVTPDGSIFALDFDKNIIRFFEPKS